ncbi:hypothetical protein DWZ21_03695 [Hungatella hathewayi]|uniref:Uncharacterized protein n=1 Tax=Enterocloster bolteae TaxID=208479 RepID=A0A412Z864_9FIRM|nr:hypothetical protein DWZ21_03695 [Hungatella hathewayi]RGQ63942.1 hypothetical protein DWY91_00440 [Enterocloster bolteae]RGS13923.1 hypothetical protein DWY12_01925 [Enterocloster bolteae]RGV76221.1 hypothetical protein DWW02_12705 [Enterocloster bolteae]
MMLHLFTCAARPESHSGLAFDRLLFLYLLSIFYSRSGKNATGKSCLPILLPVPRGIRQR